MLAIATTTITILGTTTINDYGDVLDSEEVATTGIPAAIHELRETVATESDPQARVVHYYVGRLPNGTVVDSGQRIRDDRTNIIYVIDYVVTPTNPAVPQDVRLDLRRVT